MRPRTISMAAAQRRYDNLTEDDMRPKRRSAPRPPADEDYEDESYYKSREYARMMDAYENRMDHKYDRE